MTSHRVMALILWIVILHAGSSASLATEREPVPDYPGILRSMYSTVRDTGDFAIVRDKAATIQKYFNDVITNIFADDGEPERIEDLCTYYLFLLSRREMNDEEWGFVAKTYENGRFWGARLPLLYLYKMSPSFQAYRAVEIDRLRLERRIEFIWSDRTSNRRPDAGEIEAIRTEVGQGDFVPRKTADFLLAHQQSERRDIAEEMFTFILCSGWHLPARHTFAVLGDWPYLTELRSLAEYWVKMTVERGGRIDTDLLAWLDASHLALGESFGEVLSIYRALPSIFRPHQVLMTTALASGNGANVDRAMGEIKGTPGLYPSVRQWLSYFAGNRIEESAADWHAFACFAPFMNQTQCYEVATSILSRLRRPNAGLVELDEGIKCYCALKHKRSVDEHEMMEIARLRLPYLWRSHLVRYILGRRLPVNVLPLMPEYAVVDFRDEDPGGPFKVYGISRVREAMKLRKPSEFGAFDEMSSDIFMMLRVLFLLLIKAEEG
jgi:hypothetical protein